MTHRGLFRVDPIPVGPAGTPDVTLAEHAAAVRACTRGQSAEARRPGQHRPRFVQRPPAATAAAASQETLEAIRRIAPAVETRDLAHYEALAAAPSGSTAAVAA